MATTRLREPTAVESLLIVDDSFAGREALTAALSADGYVFHLAGGGIEALAILAASTPDAVLLDVMMPGMDGFEVCRRLRRDPRLGEIPVLMVTGLEDRRSKIKGLEVGADDFITKPFDRTELRARVRTCVRLNRYRHLLAERLAAETQLLAEARILSHVSHELRAPLASLHQYLSILIDGIAGQTTYEQKAFLQIAAGNLRHVERMIDDLLEASRAQNGKLRILPQEVRFKEVAQTVIDTFSITAAAKEVTLKLDVADDPPSVYADPQRLFQILGNLIDNGIKFTPRGGSVTVRSESPREAEGWATVSVADTGCGVHPEDRERLFDHFYQGRHGSHGSIKGLGLGLHICRQLVTGHGGRIWLETVPGEGSVFHFTLPLYTTVLGAGHEEPIEEVVHA